MSLRDTIIANSGVRKYKTETIEGLGEFRLRSLFENEYQSGVSKWFRNGNTFEVIPERQKYDRIKAIQMCLVNDDDTLMFTDSIADLDILAGLGSAVVDQLFDSCYDLIQAPRKPKNE